MGDKQKISEVKNEDIRKPQKILQEMNILECSIAIGKMFHDRLSLQYERHLQTQGSVLEMQAEGEGKSGPPRSMPWIQRLKSWKRSGKL